MRDDPVMDAEPSEEHAKERSQPSIELDNREIGYDGSNSSDFNSELSEHAEDGDEEILSAQVDPDKTWKTSEDEDIKCIERLAQCIRCDTLLPPPLDKLLLRYLLLL